MSHVRAMVASVLTIAALALAGCGSTPPAADKPAPSEDVGDSCNSGEDCTLVDACCGCNAGGQKLALHKNAVAAFEESRPQRCGDVVCAQMISQDPTCDAEAICGNRNRCRVAPHAQHQ
jgi:hypothetical protein